MRSKNLHDAIRGDGGAALGCAPADVAITEDRVAGPAGGARRFAAFAGLSAEGIFLNKKHTYTYGAHAAHVTVDARTGEVAILDYVAVVDCGRIINPMTVRGQVIGSLVQGLGGAMLEHLVYDEEGQLLTGSLADYLLPTASDFPNLRAIVTDELPLADQSARRQGRRGGRHHLRRRHHGECGRQRARARSASSRASCR